MSEPHVVALLPVTSAQRGMLAEAMEDPERYVGQQCYAFAGDVRAGAAEQAWLEVCLHHEALRARILRHERGLMQVVYGVPASNAFAFHDLSAIPSSSRTVRAQELCRVAFETGTDCWSGPWAHLTVIGLGPGLMWICLTHEHVGIDGRSIQILIDELSVKLSETPAAGAPAISMSETLRGVRNLSSEPLPLPDGILGVELATFAYSNAPTRPETVKRTADAEALIAAAAASGLSPASTIGAALLGASASYRRDEWAVGAFSHDLRLRRAQDWSGVVGMFTSTLLALLPWRTGSPLVDLAHQVARGTVSATGFPPIADGLREARRGGARGRPDILITVFTDGSGLAVARKARWALLWAREATEFALDLTVGLSGSRIDLIAAFDNTRLQIGTVEEILARGLASSLEPNRGRAQRFDVPGIRDRPSHPSGPADLAVVSELRGLAELVVQRAVDTDEDLYAGGFESLQLLELVALLADQGYRLTMSELLEVGTLSGAARRAQVRRASPAGFERSDHAASASPIEAGLLNLASTGELGLAPAHEQSVLTFDTPLDSQRLEDALCAQVDAFPSLGRCWSPSADLTYRSQPRIDLSLERVRASDLILPAARRLLEEDLHDSFRPDGRALMRYALITAPDSCALFVSFHCSMLDGWSFGTFVRDIQRRYTDGASATALGEDSGPFRTWSRATNREAQRSLLQHNLGVGSVSRPQPMHAAPETARRSMRRVASKVQDFAARNRVSASAVFYAAAFRATLASFSETETTQALRMSLRGGSRHARARTVGQLTVDLPIALRLEGVHGDALAVGAALRSAYRDGQCLTPEFTRRLTGCKREQLPFATVVVLENYFDRDERSARSPETSPWTERSSWRRDVPLAPRMISIRQNGADVDLELTSTIDRRPQASLACWTQAFADTIATLHRHTT